MNRDRVIPFQCLNVSSSLSKKEIIMRCSTLTLVVTLVLTAGVAAAQQPFEAWSDVPPGAQAPPYVGGPSNPGGHTEALTFWNNRASFAAAFPGLPTESFSGTSVAAGSIVVVRSAVQQHNQQRVLHPRRDHAGRRDRPRGPRPRIDAAAGRARRWLVRQHQRARRTRHLRRRHHLQLQPRSPSSRLRPRQPGSPRTDRTTSRSSDRAAPSESGPRPTGSRATSGASTRPTLAASPASFSTAASIRRTPSSPPW